MKDDVALPEYNYSCEEQALVSFCLFQETSFLCLSLLNQSWKHSNPDIEKYLSVFCYILL